MCRRDSSLYCNYEGLGARPARSPASPALNPSGSFQHGFLAGAALLRLLGRPAPRVDGPLFFELAPSAVPARGRPRAGRACFLLRTAEPRPVGHVLYFAGNAELLAELQGLHVNAVFPEELEDHRWLFG